MKKLFRSIIDHIDDEFNFCEQCALKQVFNEYQRDQKQIVNQLTPT